MDYYSSPWPHFFDPSMTDVSPLKVLNSDDYLRNYHCIEHPTNAKKTCYCSILFDVICIWRAFFEKVPIIPWYASKARDSWWGCLWYPWQRKICGLHLWPIPEEKRFDVMSRLFFFGVGHGWGSRGSVVRGSQKCSFWVLCFRRVSWCNEHFFKKCSKTCFIWTSFKIR